MRISDWSSDVCSSDLRSETKTDADRTARADIVAVDVDHIVPALLEFAIAGAGDVAHFERDLALRAKCGETLTDHRVEAQPRPFHDRRLLERASLKPPAGDARSEEHTSELQSLMRISYAVFCLKKKITYLRQR